MEQKIDTYPIYEHKDTGERFTCIFHALCIGFEWYGFKKKGDFYFGYLMNLTDPMNEFGYNMDMFGYFDVIEVLSVCNKKAVSVTPKQLSNLLPPIGFRRIM